MARGKIRIFTGTGHCKTPAAMGLALFTAADGGQAVIIQFFKGRGLPDTEFSRKLDPEIKVFRFEKSDIPWKEMTQEQRTSESANIRNGLNFAKKVLDTGECRILIMDDVLGLIDNGILTVDEMGEILDHRDETDVILTGAEMDNGLCRFADEIVEMTEVPFRNYSEFNSK